MKLIITNCFFLIVLSLTYHPSLSAQNDKPSFTSQTTSSSTTGAGQTPVIVQFNSKVQNNRVLLNWTADNNEVTDRFELEKSTDGKNFKTAALLFGTDKPGSDNYLFFEKAGKGKIYYRIKIIQKNKNITWSEIFAVNKTN